MTKPSDTTASAAAGGACLPERLTPRERGVLAALFGRTAEIPERIPCESAVETVFLCTSTREFRESVAARLVARDGAHFDALQNWLSLEEAFFDWFGYAALPQVLGRDVFVLQDLVVSDLIAGLAARAEAAPSVAILGGHTPVGDLLQHFAFVSSVVRTARSDDVQIHLDAVRGGLIGGWAFDARRKCFPEIRWLVEDGTVPTLDMRRVYRPEVSAHVGFQDALGFEIALGEHVPKTRLTVTAVAWPDQPTKYVRSFAVTNHDYEPYAQTLSAVMAQMSEEIRRVSRRAG